MGWQQGANFSSSNIAQSGSFTTCSFKAPAGLALRTFSFCPSPEHTSSLPAGTRLLPNHICYWLDMFLLSHPFSSHCSIPFFVLCIPLHLPPGIFLLRLWQPLKHPGCSNLVFLAGSHRACCCPEESVQTQSGKKHFFHSKSNVCSLACAAWDVLLTPIKGASISGITGNFHTWLMAGLKDIHSVIHRRKGMCWACLGSPGCAFQIPFMVIGDCANCRVKEPGLCGIFLTADL